MSSRKARPGATHWAQRCVLHPERQRVRKTHRADARASSKCREPTSAMAVNEPGLGSSADGKGEKGIDGSLERTGTLLYLGE